MASLRLDIEQWGAILAQLNNVPNDRRKPCLQQAIDQIRDLLVSVERARRELGDPRDAFTHDCAASDCAAFLLERAREPVDGRATTLGPTCMELLQAEFGAFFVLAPMADGNLALLATDNDKGTLRKNVVKAAQSWVDDENQKKS